MMKRLICICALVALLFSCGPRDEATKAVLVAKHSYQYLLKGKASSFVDATYHESEIPESYREQLVLSAEMFVEHQDSLHGGIKEIEALKAVLYDEGNAADAYLQFQYADGQSEQVLVPMVKHEDNWYLK